MQNHYNKKSLQYKEIIKLITLYHSFTISCTNIWDYQSLFESIGTWEKILKRVASRRSFIHLAQVCIETHGSLLIETKKLVAVSSFPFARIPEWALGHFIWLHNITPLRSNCSLVPHIEEESCQGPQVFMHCDSFDAISGFFLPVQKFNI